MLCLSQVLSLARYIALVKTQEIMLWSQIKYSAHLALWVKTHDNRNVTYELGCHLDL